MPLKHSSVFAGSYFSWDSCKTLCMNFSVFLFLPSSFSREELTCDLLTKIPLKVFFIKTRNRHFEQKTLNTQKYKNTFKKHIKYLKSFWVWSTSNWVYTSHLNTYNHTNEISIHWTLDLCVVCVDQVWTSL